VEVDVRRHGVDGDADGQIVHDRTDEGLAFLQGDLALFLVRDVAEHADNELLRPYRIVAGLNLHEADFVPGAEKGDVVDQPGFEGKGLEFGIEAISPDESLRVQDALVLSDEFVARASENRLRGGVAFDDAAAVPVGHQNGIQDRVE